MNDERRVGAPVTGKRVAIIGANFAGLGCADILVEKGYQVTILESKLTPDVYEVQNSKTGKEAWQEKRQEFERAGVKFVMNTGMGKDKMIDTLFKEGFKAIFIDVGFEIDMKMEDTPGADLSGVYDAADFLIRANTGPIRLSESIRKPLEIGRRVVVIGRGDVVADCLRTALRLGSEDVICLCNCTEDEMSGETKVRKTEHEVGVKYRFLTSPVKFIAGADGKLAAVECIEMKLGEPDAMGNQILVSVEGSNFSVAADTAIINRTISGINKYIKDKFNGTHLHEGVFVGGDRATGPDFVADAMESGRKVAFVIDEYLQSIV